ncbi:MAG: helix-turn-helix domain-containing protein [Actinomycetaceae bacterium]|nr:helix-turn-helix domain-containing protein [Actinomycetaceae bacterium]
MEPRFYTISDVAEMFALSEQGVRAMIRSGELRAIQVGGSRQWRIEKSVLEQYIENAYKASEAALKAK